jgi:hypothetical protein
MTSLLTTANRYGWAGKNLRAGLAARRHPAGTNAPASGNLSLSIFSGQYPVIQDNAGVVTTVSSLPFPAMSIALLPSGNYVIVGTQRVYVMTPSGTVTVIAGSATSGTNDGTGTGAFFTQLVGVCVISATRVAVMDNSRIRVVTSSTWGLNSGIVVTVAGQLTQGYADGTGTSAQFYPRSFKGYTGLAVLSNGTIAVADGGNCVIRLVVTNGVLNDGVVTTLAGSNGVFGSADGTGTSARFQNSISGLAVIPSTGNLIVVDGAGIGLVGSIRLISSSTWTANTGIVTTLAGGSSSGYADGTGTSARFGVSYGVVIDSTNNVYIADGSRIRMMTTSTWGLNSGIITTLAGDGTYAEVNGTGTGAQFKSPTSIALDENNNLYVIDPDGPRCRKIT